MKKQSKIRMLFVFAMVAEIHALTCNPVRLIDYPTPNSNQAIIIGNGGLLYAADSFRDSAVVFDLRGAVNDSYVQDIDLAPQESFGTITFSRDRNELYMGVYGGRNRVEAINPLDSTRTSIINITGTFYGISYDAQRMYVGKTAQGLVEAFVPPVQFGLEWTSSNQTYCSGVCLAPNGIVGVVAHRQRLYISHRSPNMLYIYNVSSGNLLASLPTAEAWYIGACGNMLIYPTLTANQLEIRHLNGTLWGTFGSGAQTTLPTDFSRPVGATCEAYPDHVMVYVDEGQSERINVWRCETPTESPTHVPSKSPTFSPTAFPTSNPTSSPTDTPTSNPTSSPTAFPTSNPTSSPTDTPTSNPTSSPTDIPSRSPTFRPTAVPTGNPTSHPTSNPISSPTGVPTSSPTSSPTGSPTTSPSLSPTQNLKSMSVCQISVSSSVSCFNGTTQILSNVTLPELTLTPTDVLVISAGATVSVSGTVVLDGALQVQVPAGLPEGSSSITLLSYEGGSPATGQFQSITAVGAERSCETITLQDVDYSDGSGLTALFVKDSSACLNVALIAGASVGGAALIIVLIVIVYSVHRKRKLEEEFAKMKVPLERHQSGAL